MCYGCCGGAGVLWRCWGAVAVLGGCCCRCQEELPYFGDIVESCQDGKCPLVQFSPLPYFRNDGLLLKQFRHQQEFNICCKDEVRNDQTCRPTICVQGCTTSIRPGRPWLDLIWKTLMYPIRAKQGFRQS
eukprot:scpid82711/ scgid1530/ 